MWNFSPLIRIALPSLVRRVSKVETALCQRIFMNDKNTSNVSSTKNTVYISNLSYKRDRNALKSMFLAFGQIKNIKIIVEPTTNQSRGMAFVEMSSATEAMNAINGLNGKIFDGRTVKAKPATPLKSSSIPFQNRVPMSAVLKAKPKVAKDLSYVSIQLAKKARNEARRKSNPLQFKVKAKP